MNTKYSTNREILSKFKTRHRQYFYISDPRYPGKMVAAIYDPEGGAPVVVGVFQRMKTRQQFQWLSGRLDKLVDVFADFQAMNDYQIMLAEELVRLDPTGLDLTPGERPGWVPDEDTEEDGAAQDDGDAGEEIVLPMRASMIRKRTPSAARAASKSTQTKRQAPPPRQVVQRGAVKKAGKRFL